MKVALVRKEYTRLWGGAEAYAVTLSTQLVERGHEVHVFANRWDTPPDPRITFHRIPMIGFYSPLKNLSFALNAKRLLGKDTFDIVNGLSQVYPQDVYRMGDGLHRHFLTLDSSNSRFKLFRHLDPRHAAVLFIERNIFKPANYHQIIANSNMCKRQAEQYYGVPEDRIEVIVNGVNNTRFNPSVRAKYRAGVRSRLLIAPGETVLLFVSRNHRRKGLDLLIRSISLLGEKAASVKALVVGRGNRKHYQRLARSRGVKESVLFVGEAREIEQYYAASDVLVLPTRYDPFSNVCLEAMACGLPIITTRSNGAAEIITEGQNGHILESPGEVTSLAGMIEHLLSREVREEMGISASTTARHYTPDENAAKTIVLFEKVAARKKVLACSTSDGMVVNDAYRELLVRNGLTDATNILNYRYCTVVKDAGRERSTVKLTLKDRAGEVGAYLKRYRATGIAAALRSLLPSPPSCGAFREWKTITLFNRMGIPTMTPLACGLQEGTGLSRVSFLLTKELEGTERLDHYIPRHFTPPLTGRQVSNKRSLIRELALLVRRLHRLGFNHRDLYLCHLLVKEAPPSAGQIYLVDLHRVDYRKRMRGRWMVKDLAALNYSAEAKGITRTDRLRFILHYQGAKTLTSGTKSMIGRVLKKTDAIRSHDLKLRKRASST